MPAAIAVPAIIGAAGVGAQVYGAHKAAGAAKDAAKIQSQAGEQVAKEATATANEAATGVTDAANTAIGGVNEAAGRANDILSEHEQDAQGRFDPYSEAGQQALTYLSDLLKPGGGLDEKFAFQFNPDEDPGYQFRMQQGQKALEGSAASRGSVLSGGTLKSLANYSQGLASQEFGNSFNRALQSFQANQAARGQRLSGLTGIAGFGLNAAGQLADVGKYFGGMQSGNVMDAARSAGQFGMSGAQAAGGFRMQGQEIAGNARTGAANAQAAGKVGAANAWNQGIGGAVNSAQDAVMLASLLKGTPATVKSPVSTGYMQGSAYN